MRPEVQRAQALMPWLVCSLLIRPKVDLTLRKVFASCSVTPSIVNITDMELMMDVRILLPCVTGHVRLRSHTHH